MHGNSSVVSSREKKLDPESNDDNDLTNTPPLRQTWTEEEHKAVQKVFADQISRQSVTMREVVALKQTHPLLKHFENKRLLDKIRGLYRFKKIDSDCLQDIQRGDDAVKEGDSDASSIMGPSTSQSKSRVFDEEEVSQSVQRTFQRHDSEGYEDRTECCGRTTEAEWPWANL